MKRAPDRPISGRQSERESLERALRSGKSEFLAVYGRRRVGKTFLIRRFFRDRDVTYFEMIGRYQGTLQDHLRIFAESLAETFAGAGALQPATSWHDAFRSLGRAVETRRGRRGRIIVFLDELPWMDTHRSGCLRELEHFWNSWCSRRNDIVLIVCGSAASWMIERIVRAKGGLHDRLTGALRLIPFTLAETRQFFEDRGLRFTAQELVELYMIFGGVPHYLDHVERGLSVAQIVDRTCLHKDGALAREFDGLYASLFDADRKHVDVVRALSRKRRGLTRDELLAAVSRASGGGATDVLENLEEGGFVTSTVPFGRSARDRLYRLTDEFSRFHLRWLEHDRPRRWEHVRRTPRWHAWTGPAFEALCLKHDEQIERALGISGIRTHVCAWQCPEAQIDLLIDRADDVISLCEIKFSERRNEWPGRSGTCAAPTSTTKPKGCCSRASPPSAMPTRCRWKRAWRRYTNW